MLKLLAKLGFGVVGFDWMCSNVKMRFYVCPALQRKDAFLRLPYYPPKAAIKP